MIKKEFYKKRGKERSIEYNNERLNNIKKRKRKIGMQKERKKGTFNKTEKD
jgi:hypothetical protein